MSFFVSKSLEGKVDENCLIPSEENDTLHKEFVLEIDKFTCCIRDIEFSSNLPNSGTLVLKTNFDCNIHTIDYLVSNFKCKAKIRFKKSVLFIKEFKIENIFKKDGDNYIVGLTAYYTIEEQKCLK